MQNVKTTIKKIEHTFCKISISFPFLINFCIEARKCSFVRINFRSTWVRGRYVQPAAKYVSNKKEYLVFPALCPAQGKQWNENCFISNLSRIILLIAQQGNLQLIQACCKLAHRCTIFLCHLDLEIYMRGACKTNF